jgi:hypothetical protein
MTTHPTAEAAIAHYVGEGYGVESHTGATIVLARQRKVRWLLHLFLCLILTPLWLIVPIVQIVNRKRERVILNEAAPGRWVGTPA